ncbi:hypothetical protein A3D84_05890 [Candidatus Woesebacteria bacterium RIFCSPHIGHO2_02_FULL_42_20]|uniref:ATP-cone domain-containing protein n=1 Tax=Candidatus Woesebacteria bacterium RIFCSPHIGHO2_12_FULL_41_24 TaxID=1802510 RepID=A0A1F8ATC6_9BACT|nr:MAG: hypothetical protein A2W15_01430 [Candidatus Woesebacteria bacterium RBG_16_41_13]OGM29881.1 MAG: hypothetical protein A2873_04240 [Candidatus Woesebacteria bacterium RIFCSPHIGHO2_01_FULL_42_80]OGM35318.1 MAG: hypothetical protein A3D84_05890 [Candidatus Woesebacteria bacterium RIFCSPHIGHO2_02_FULL_42_20]OGM54931.1 MAG: hypothetical protein A3E44_03885 [Candidatus Woesebacteria bacterium RIFCSPHIGHO2_12_FULL_41_24]OGM67562.1 MAG: hypothetical protein A2969_01290 [Candidatus Woesebacteri
MKVTKKDGSQEDFDRNKIVAGALKSGASQEEAEKVAGQVEAWARSVEGGVVASDDIAAKVAGALRAFNPGAASSFEAYRASKTK